MRTFCFGCRICLTRVGHTHPPDAGHSVQAGCSSSQRASGGWHVSGFSVRAYRFSPLGIQLVFCLFHVKLSVLSCELFSCYFIFQVVTNICPTNDQPIARITQVMQILYISWYCYFLNSCGYNTVMQYLYFSEVWRFRGNLRSNFCSLLQVNMSALCGLCGMAQGHGLNSLLFCCQVVTLGKLFTHVPLSPSNINWYQ